MHGRLWVHITHRESIREMFSRQTREAVRIGIPEEEYDEPFCAWMRYKADGRGRYA